MGELSFINGVLGVNQLLNPATRRIDSLTSKGILLHWSNELTSGDLLILNLITRVEGGSETLFCSQVAFKQWCILPVWGSFSLE